MRILKWTKGAGPNWRHLVEVGREHTSIVSICNPNKIGRRKKMIRLWFKHQFGRKKK